MSCAISVAMCSVEAMARAAGFGVSNLSGLSVWRPSSRLGTGRFTRRRSAHMCLSSGRNPANGRSEQEGGLGTVNSSGHPVQWSGRSLQPAGVRGIDGSLFRIGFLLACPSLGLALVDSNAVAAELGPMSSTLSADMLPRVVPFLGDLDPGTAQLATSLVGPFINIFNILFIFRIVMSWYPGIPVKKFPFFLAYNPTEPVLGPTRRLIPPVGGVDVAPVIWVALMSFANEILLGKQGLLVLLSQQQS